MKRGMIRPGVRGWFRLRLWRRDLLAAELDDELRLHVELRTEQLVRQGYSPERARAEAIARLGGLEEARRSLYRTARRREDRMRVREGVDGLRQDVRYALRALGKRPLLSGAVVLTAALGIAATTAIFSLIDALLLTPLPYPDSDRIVRVEAFDTRGGLAGTSNPADVADWKASARSVTAMAAYQSYGGARLALEDGVTRLGGSAAVGAGMDRVLGIRAAVGRLFRAEDYAPGAATVVLSDGLWRARFGADPGVVGRSIVISGVPRTVVGVLPPSTHPFPGGGHGVWLPLRLPEPGSASNRAGVWLWTVARIRPGVAQAGAEAELKAVAARLRSEYPGTNAYRDVRLVRLRDSIAGPVRPAVLLVAATIAVVLLIACANIANLLLARSQERRGDLAVHAALGAGRRRLSRQLLTESALLSAFGAALGVLLAPAILDGLLALYPGALPREAEIELGLRVLLVALAATGLAAFLAALPSVRLAGRIDLLAVLGAGGRRLGTPAERRLRQFLVVAQVALTVLLLVAGGVLLRTFFALTRTDVGFETTGLLTFNVASPPAAGTGRLERAAAFHDELLRRIRALPGVDAAGASSLLPLMSGDFIDAFLREGGDDDPVDRPSARLQAVTPGYLEALGLSLRRGRTLAAGDRAGAPGVVVVSEQLAERYFVGEDPIGRRIRFQKEEWEIVGIVSGKRHGGPQSEAAPELYVPRSQLNNQGGWAWYAVRTAADPTRFVATIRAFVREQGGGAVIDDIATMTERMDRAVAPERFRAVLVGSLGGLALVLALLGLYGVISLDVARQTREIGICIALGEDPGRTLGRVIGGALRLTGLGILVGLAVAMIAGTALEGFVFGVATRDPVTMVGVSLLFLLVAAAAALGPARRAARVDPIIAIRAD